MAKDNKGAKELLKQARERWPRARDADQANRRLAVDDIKFAHEPGAQWEQTIRDERGDRPCYEFNRLRISVKRVINDIRANRPQGKVRAVEDGDKDTSNVMEGLVRNVWSVSDGDSAVDTAAEYQVAGGMGAWRINTRYSTDDAWDQDIVIEALRNPFALWADPNARDPMKRDADFWFLESRISKTSYEAKYGKVPAVEWESSEFDDEDEWEDDDRVRICEYWYKKPYSRTLALLPDGKSVPLEDVPQGMKPLRTRQVQDNKICMAIISGDKVLEGPIEWAGNKFPFVQIYGEYVVIDGKVKWWGLVRHGKDSQRLHNAMLTNAVETSALAPQSKWWATPAQALGNTADWARAHKENLPYLLANPDPQQPGFPQQMNGAQIPAAFVNLAMLTADEIKATNGIYDPSLGAKTNAVSGVAKRSEIAQGEIANFNFSDNIARGIRYTWELLLDLIPKIYDTERSVRVLGTDGAERYARINTIDPQTGQALNDLSRGKYDVTVTVGPSFSTQRQEAAETYIGLSQANPAVMGVAGDLIFKSLDLPYAEDMAERMRSMLPPQIQQMLQSKEQNSGKPLPPEAQHAIMQAQSAMQMVEQQSQLVQQAAAEAEGMKAEAESAVSKLNVEQANLEAQYQRIVADLAKKEAALTMKEAGLVAKQTQAGVDDQSKAVEGERESLSQDFKAAVAELQSGVAQFMAQAAQTIVQMQQSAQPQVVVANEPRNKVVRVKRVNGELIGTVEES